MEQTQWSPPTGGIVGCGAAGLMMAIAAAAATSDLPGRMLLGLAAAGLIVFAAMSWRARPKVALHADGLRIRGWWNTQLLNPGDIAAADVSEFHRVGRRVRLLELETRDDRLIVLSRWDVGTDPSQVLDALVASGFAPKH